MDEKKLTGGFCERCGEYFNQSKILERHRIQVCGLEKRILNCSICESGPFYSVYTLDRHQISCTKRSEKRKKKLKEAKEKSEISRKKRKGGGTCPKCGLHFPLTKNLKRHRERVCDSSLTNRRCSVCDKSFSSVSNYDRHRLKCGVSSIDCQKCDRKNFKSTRSLKIHDLRFHNRPEEEKSGDGVDDDNVSSSSGGEEEPGPSWSSKGAREYKRARCAICGVWFLDYRALRRHVHKTHRPPRRKTEATEDRPHKCSECSASFKRLSTLKFHLRSKHWGEIEPPPWLSSSSSSSDGEKDSSDEDEEQGLPPPEKLYKRVGYEGGRNVHKFSTTEKQMTFTLKRKGISWSSKGFGVEVMEAILRDILRDYFGKSGYIQLYLSSFTLDFPIKMKLFRPSDVLIHAFMNQIERLISSKDRFLFDSPITLQITYTEDPIERMELGYKVPFSSVSDHREFMIRTSFVFNPTSLEAHRYTCLGQTIVAYFKQRADPLGYRKSIWYRNGGIGIEFMEEVIQLYSDCQVSIFKPQKEPELNQFQHYLSERYELQLICYSAPQQKSVIYSGYPRRNYNSRINLAVTEDFCHVGLILNLPGYLNREFCHNCERMISKTQFPTHECSKIGICSDCQSLDCFRRSKLNPDSDLYLSHFCHNCKISFKNENCFRSHLLDGICGKRIKCSVCHKIVSRDGTDGPPGFHSCSNTVRCINCRSDISAEENHACTVSRSNPNRIKSPDSYYVYVYDFECMRMEDGKLEPYLLCSHKSCQICFWNSDPLSPCENCGPRTRDFYGVDNAKETGIKYLFFDDQRDTAAKVFLFAHNAARFDSTYLVDYLLRNNHKPSFGFNGTKVMFLKYGKVIAKDFYLFSPVALKKCYKVFGLEEEKSCAVKGDCPLFYARPDTLFQKTRMGFPAKEYYPAYLYSREKKDLDNFLRWYEENKNSAFNFKDEVVKYCRNDVMLLFLSIRKYREISRKISKGMLDPLLSEGINTIASFSSALFRTVFMKEDSICLTPSSCSSPKRFSVEASKIICFLNHQRIEAGLPIYQYGSNGGEKKIGNYYLDGFIPEEQRGLEILGCWFHSCAICYPHLVPEDIHPLLKKTHRAIRDRDGERLELLRTSPELVNGLIVLRPCQFYKSPILRPIFESFWSTRSHILPNIAPDDIREAVYGGLTQNFSLFRKFTPTEIEAGYGIEFVDINSQYPFQMLTEEYPRGICQIIDSPQLPGFGRNWRIQTLQEFVPCLISLWILPPTDEIYPILPCRVRGKTIFTLCYTCALLEQQEECQHRDPRKRGLIGIYSSPEILYALTVGYNIIQVFRIWTWKEGKGGPLLFEEYMKVLIKGKAEASGLPENYRMENYIDSWKRERGISLDPENIISNPGLKHIWKLLLNSFYGKTIQKEIKTSVEVIKEWWELRRKLMEGARLVEFSLTESGQSALVTLERNAEEIAPKGFNSVHIGAFTTGYARIQLLKLMNSIPGKVLYTDTDSIFYEYGPGTRRLPEGPLVGQLASELKPGEIISSFISPAPKNYRFSVVSKEDPGGGIIREEHKMKGITLSLALKDALTEEVYMGLVEKRLDKMERFYSNLLSENYPLRRDTWIEARRLFGIQKDLMERFEIPADLPPVPPTDPGLYLVSPRMRRRISARSSGIEDQPGAIKLIKMHADKRIFVPALCSDFSPSLQGSSVPFGWKIPDITTAEYFAVFDREIQNLVLNNDNDVIMGE